MPEPTVLDGWDERAVAAAGGDVWIPARALPNPPPACWCARLVPTTAGSETPEDAVDTARLAARIVGHRRVVVTIRVDGVADEGAEAEAETTLVAAGFDVQKPNRSGS